MNFLESHRKGEYLGMAIYSYCFVRGLGNYRDSLLTGGVWGSAQGGEHAEGGVP